MDGFADPVIEDSVDYVTIEAQSAASIRYHANKIPTNIVAAPTRISRVLDVVISSLALTVLLPVFVFICLVIWLQDGGAPIFAHRRIGRLGEAFPCLKFRTMVTDAERRLFLLLDSDAQALAEWQRDHKLRHDPRITKIGIFLRRSSLDEMPQLINVLLGQMSLVGPRPIVASEVPRYGRYFVYYCMVRPGITGLWQVSGRNDVSYRRRVVIDTVYCRTKSIGFDLLILMRTIPAIFSGKGAS